MAWFWISILVLVCAAVGGYVYFAEYRDSALEPAPAERDEDLTRIEERR
jgi:hypothetical protein